MATANIKAVITAEDRSSRVLSGFGTNVKDVANKAAIGLVAAGAALTAFAKNATDFTTDYLKASKDISRETGISITEASRLTYVTKRLGISAEEASQVFGIFSKKIKESAKDSATAQAQQGELQQSIEKIKLEIRATTRELEDNAREIKKNGDKSGDLRFKAEQLNFKLKELNTELASVTGELNKSGAAFDKIGVATKNADGSFRTFEQILFATADKFQKMPDGIEKTALAMELFGRSGKDMLPVLNLGSQGIQNLQKEADKLGLTLNENTIAKVTQLIQSQKDLKATTEALKVSIGTATAPVLTAFNQKVAEVLQKILASDGATRDWTIAILAFGGPVATATGALIGFVANITTVIANLISMKIATDAATTSTVGLRAALLSPMYVTISVLGALAALGLVIAKAIETKNVVDQASANIAESARIAERAWDQLLTKAATGNTRAQQMLANKGVRSAPVSGTPSFAGGVENFAGGLAYVHKGEVLANLPKGTDVIPRDKARGMGGGSILNFNINIGMYAGTEIEKRKIAKELLRAAKDLANSKGTDIATMFG